MEGLVIHMFPHKYSNGSGGGWAIVALGLACGTVWAWIMAELLLRV